MTNQPCPCCDARLQAETAARVAEAKTADFEGALAKAHAELAALRTENARLSIYVDLWLRQLFTIKRLTGQRAILAAALRRRTHERDELTREWLRILTWLIEDTELHTGLFYAGKHAALTFLRELAKEDVARWRRVGGE